MRLDDFDPNAINVEDQRGGRFGVPMGGTSVGCGGLLLLLIGSLVFGVDLSPMVGGMSQQSAPQVQAQGGTSLAETCSIDQVSREACNTMSSLNKTWGTLFAQHGAQYQPPKLVFYSQMGQSGCGMAQSAMGPFYCPADQGVYLDTTFYNELQNRFGASGDFARAYVIAHEVGHHIQTITGRSQKVQQAQARMSKVQANQMQVRMELEADCLAGVWANLNRDKIEPGDIEEGMRAAEAIGDDMLMRSAGQRVLPDNFTHGSSQQRMEWLNRGMQTGDPRQCNTFG